jgi:hypothetical protein
VLEVISSQRFGKHGGDELNVIKIQPNVKKSKDMPKQRVAAYCRVSTDNSGQIESLETQTQKTTSGPLSAGFKMVYLKYHMRHTATMF